MGIENSVEETELRSTLIACDNKFERVKDFVIREGKNGLRIRALLGAGYNLIRKKRIRMC